MARAEVQTPGRMLRSERKRAVIMAAAEALFVSEGYERTSVDAIAARAGVSKRTVYDHFGDKQTLFLRVLERVHGALVVTVRAALDEELTQGRDLRAALVAFAVRVAMEAFPSSDYVTFRRLTSQATPKPPAAVREQPERMLEERFAKLVADGEIGAADPGRAAQHFTALTILLALDALDALDDEPESSAKEPEVRAIIEDGVDAFLRAYR